MGGVQEGEEAGRAGVAAGPGQDCGFGGYNVGSKSEKVPHPKAC